MEDAMKLLSVQRNEPLFDAQRALALLVARARRMALGKRAPTRFLLFVSAERERRLAPYRGPLVTALTQHLGERLRACGLTATDVKVALKADPSLMGNKMHAQAFMARAAEDRFLLIRPSEGGMPQRVPLPEGRIAVGRMSGNDIALSDPLMSKHHAEFVVTSDGGVQVRDLGSKNGTFVNGERLPEGIATPLRCGDEVRCGRTTFMVEE
jgi:hypothetical protein